METPPNAYARQAKTYILKLIHIQQKIEEKGYKRLDQHLVRNSRLHLTRTLNYFPLNTDDKMKAFFDNNQHHIRTLVPSVTHPAFTKLMDEFQKLKNQI